MSCQHLDLKCAEFAEVTLVDLTRLVLCDDALSVVLDAGSVLPKQGPYAMVLYLLQKRRKKPTDPKKPADILLEGVNCVLKQIAIGRDTGDALQTVKKLSETLSELLLARKLLILYLTYLKYQLKAKSPDA